MTKYNVYLYDGYYGFKKKYSKAASTVDEVIAELKVHFKEETELFGSTANDGFTNGRKYQIKVGRKVVAEFELYYDKENGYNF